MNHEALETMWEQSRTHQAAGAADWGSQMEAIHACGKGLEETLRYLYHETPSLEDFLRWMNLADKTDNRVSDSNDVLSGEYLDLFAKNGYLVFPNAIDTSSCKAACDAILDHLNADINDPASWYATHEDRKGLMLQLFHHPALEAARHSPRIRKAFEQLYSSTAIHPVIEKVSFNPPENNSFSFAGSPLHWDVSLVQPIPFKLQGLLYLSDCGADAGAFHCVPGFHQQVGEWLRTLPPNANARDEAARYLQPTPVPGKAGDLVIWHQALPHCATPNRGSLPRFVQYLTYDPDGYCQQEVWI